MTYALDIKALTELEPTSSSCSAQLLDLPDYCHVEQGIITLRAAGFPGVIARAVTGINWAMNRPCKPWSATAAFLGAGDMMCEFWMVGYGRCQGRRGSSLVKQVREQE